MLLCALLTASASATGRSLEDLGRALARAPPVTTGFVEYRFSHLLKKPLRTAGTLEYRGDGMLARKVDSPYREVTEVEGDTVRIARGDKPARTISLARAPQLRILLGSFRALLDGQFAPLTHDFDVTLEEQERHWTLTFRPKDASLAKHLERIDVYGSGDRPDCVEALEPDGDAAFTLFTDTPGIAEPAIRADLERNCRVPAATSAQ